MKVKIDVIWNGDSTDIRFEKLDFELVWTCFWAWLRGYSWTVRTPTKVWESNNNQPNKH